MRKRCLVPILLACLCGPAFAAEPTGEWLVANGGARIRIEPCGGALWGMISWVREPATDSQNPDPAKRSRPMVGVPILRAMKQVDPNKWEGEVYNAQNGKMYSSNISLVSDDVLKIQGCVLGGIFCGGENWSRVQPEPVAPAQRPRPGTPAARPKPAVPQAEACNYD